MKLLLVEDNDLDARDVVELVSAGCSEGMTVQHVHTCAGALAALKSPEEFDVILLDLTLPDSRGEETVARLMGQNPSTPCVVLSGTDNLEVAVKALRLGAQDYLVKAQLDVALLHRAIRYAIERKRIERRLEFLAGYDQLTGLVNRFRLHDIAEHALVNAGRQRTLAALLYIDLDNFKPINDRWGHATGDVLLQIVAGRIRGVLRAGDTAARLGGDEFAVLLEGVPDRAAVVTVASKIRECLAEPYLFSGRDHRVSASIGIAMFPGDGPDLSSLLASADRAMYLAKANGRNVCQLSAVADATSAPPAPDKALPEEWAGGDGPAVRASA